MKPRYVLLASVLAGAVVGAAVTWSDFGSNPPLVAATNQGPSIGRQARAPKVIVDNDDHDFGPIESGATVTHAFRITNVGDDILKLQPGPTSCSACTISKLAKRVVAPGESVDVIVEYKASSGKPNFRQTAAVLTNDPNRAQLEFNIRGDVVSKLRLLPDRLTFSNVPADESATAEMKIICYLSDKLRVLEHKISGSAETSQFFESRVEPIGREKLGEPNALSGVRVLVTVKPGLPLGPFRQTIRLVIEAGGVAEPAFDMPIEGTIVGDLSIVGAGWRSDSGVLSLGTVNSNRGTKHQVRILARGKARQDVNIEVVRVEPPFLKVTVGKPAELNESVVQIPLEIEIPPGTPPAIHLGTNQGKFGEIELRDNGRADAKELRMHVKFAVAKGS